MNQTKLQSLCRLLIGVGALLIAPSSAQAVNAAESSRPPWENVVRFAEREGDVSVYVTNAVGDLPIIWEVFRRKYPKIKLNAVPISTTSEIVTKVVAERRANLFVPDVVLGAPGAMYNSLYRGKTLDPLPPA